MRIHKEKIPIPQPQTTEKVEIKLIGNEVYAMLYFNNLLKS